MSWVSTLIKFDVCECDFVLIDKKKFYMKVTENILQDEADGSD